LDRANSIAAIYQGGARACGARIRDYEQRIGVAESDGIDGAFRRPATHRRLRDADRLFVQPDGIDVISGDGFGVRSASGGDDDRLAHVVRPADHDDVDVDADFQGRGRRPALIACHLARGAEFICAVRTGTDRVAIIFGVDELMDMGRTCVNVVGNCLATVVVARWEKEFDESRARVFGTAAEAELDLKAADVAFADAVAQGD